MHDAQLGDGIHGLGENNGMYVGTFLIVVWRPSVGFMVSVMSTSFSCPRFACHLCSLRSGPPLVYEGDSSSAAEHCKNNLLSRSLF
jgi:hypothetical protein